MPLRVGTATLVPAPPLPALDVRSAVELLTAVVCPREVLLVTLWPVDCPRLWVAVTPGDDLTSE